MSTTDLDLYDQWQKMEPETRNAWIAEHVMGWKPHFRNTSVYVDADEVDSLMERNRGFVDTWRPATDPAADYKVLCHVREKWDEDQIGYFHQALCDVLFGHKQLRGVPLGMHYTPGDYSQAAYITLNQEQQA